MKSSVIVFPGSNCDRDIDVALKKFQITNQMVWHKDSELPKSDLVVLPGGFSYGDYLRTGCIASKSPILRDIVNHANKGGLILGICNGFQILIESGLANLPVISNSCLGGPIEILDNEKNGYLYEFNSMGNLISKIKQFEMDDKKVIFQKKVNMKIYSRNFSILKFYKNFIKYV